MPTPSPSAPSGLYKTLEGLTATLYDTITGTTVKGTTNLASDGDEDTFYALTASIRSLGFEFTSPVDIVSYRFKADYAITSVRFFNATGGLITELATNQIVDGTVTNYASKIVGVKSVRIARGGTGAANLFSLEMYTDTAVVAPIVEKHLLINKITSEVLNGSLAVIGTLPLTEAMFLDNGFDAVALNALNTSSLLDFKTARYTTDGASTPKQVTFKSIPFVQAFWGAKNYDLSLVENIDSFNALVSEVGTGKVRLAVSNDSGATWYGAGLQPILKTKEDLISKGMTATEFNGSTNDWNTFCSNGVISFAFALEVSTSSDVASIDKITINYDLMGKYRRGIHKTDYDYEEKAKTFAITILKSLNGIKVRYLQ